MFLKYISSRLVPFKLRVVFLLVATLLCFTNSGIVYGEVVVTYRKPSNHIEEVLFKQIKQSAVLQSAIELIRNRFILPKRLDIVFGESVKVALRKGPHYHDNKISIPYLYIYQLRKRLNRRRHIHQQENIDQLIFDSLTHSLFHEFGHALINQYQLPVAGLEENTVDNLANWLSIVFLPEGYSVLNSAATIFYIKSKTGKQLRSEHLRSEHRLPIQRYYTILCHIYGSDPKKRLTTKRKAGFSDERAKKCIVEYQRLSRAWRLMLTAHLSS